jgi:hypothetical protein
LNEDSAWCCEALINAKHILVHPSHPKHMDDPDVGLISSFVRTSAIAAAD